VGTTLPAVNLGGDWRAENSDDDLRRVMAEPDLDDSDWPVITVPGHWRSHPHFAGSDGPVLYRHRFATARPGAGDRSFLTFDGIFYQGDVWLDGDYLGDTEGYFFPHTFEVTAALTSGTEHVLAVEVACNQPSDLKAKRNLTGVFQHWDCIDPQWNPGGIWAPVRIHRTGPVRISALKILCRDANPDRATLELEAELETEGPVEVTVDTTVRRRSDGETAADLHEDEALAAGKNQVRWRLVVERPQLWWPWALGEQPLYDVQVQIGLDDRVSDGRVVTTGLRQIQVNNFIATVNGERVFLKGANCGPTSRALADASPDALARDVCLAREAGLDLIRVHAHITRPEVYDAADRLGMLIWQDLPLQWGYGQVRRQAAQQARQAVFQLGHHPSIALWCGHNEPVALDIAPGQATAPRTAARMVAGQILPSWNKTALDRTIRRALERADGSREVVAHSGVVPHPAWGTDSHFYFGWYHGNERDFPAMMSRFPVLARFVSEFGAQAVPNTDDFIHPERWPDLDWEGLEAHHALQRQVFDERVPPSSYPTFEAWRAATQDYQARILRHHIEALRRLKYRPTGGFCLFLLADAQPAISWSVLDHRRSPKSGYAAVKAACAPVIITADRPAESYRPGHRVEADIHVVSDLRAPLPEAEALAILRWPGGQRRWRFSGEVPPDSCTRIGRISHVLPSGIPEGGLALDLAVHWAGGGATNSYDSRVS
jgi:beta-mannosidase